MTTKAWGKPGAWAQDVEENEALQATKQEAAAEFPSLAAAAATKPKKKNKHHQTVSLAEFTTGTHIGPGGKSRALESKGLTPDEMLMLPTGPRQRSPQELEHPGSNLALGGGFRGYGAQTREREANRREGFDGDEPSRADTSEHWGSAKAFAPAGSTFPRDSGGSKADEAEDWSAGKKFTPSDRRFGGGSAFESYKESDAARDRWSRRGSDGRSGFDFFQREGGPDGDRWARREENNNNNDNNNSRAVERPRLVLQPRSSPISNGDDASAGPRPKSGNPFGEARPREEVLAEKGQDWKKIDEELGSHGWKVSDGNNSVADRLGEAPGVKGNGSWRCNSPVDGRLVRDWRKKEDAQNGQSLRLEESWRAVNGKESLTDDHVESPSNSSDVNELIQTDKELEKLTIDLGQKVHVSHRSDVGCDRTARW